MMTMEVKFSECEWSAGEMTMKPTVWASLHSGKRPITIVRSGANVIAAVWDEGVGANEAAYARLIAAAPDLYEAGSALLPACDEWLAPDRDDVDGDMLLTLTVRLGDLKALQAALLKATTP